MVLVLAAAALAVVLVVALVLTMRSGSSDAERSTRLPAGADAAIWSILEVVPDPRNHLALTRDLTGEVRIAGTALDPAVRARAAAPAVVAPAAPAPAVAAPGGLWADEPTVNVTLDDGSLDLRDFERAS